MYKRIPASFFNSKEDIYFSIIDFMEECGFTIIDNNANQIYQGTPNAPLGLCNIIYTYVLKDNNNCHYIYLTYFTSEPINNYIAMFVADDYDSQLRIEEQLHIAKKTDKELSVVGATFIGMFDTNTNRFSADLFCIYNNKSLIFLEATPLCNIYDSMYTGVQADSNAYSPVRSFIYYGNFTKYHLGYDKDVVMLASSLGGVEFRITELIDSSGESQGEFTTLTTCENNTAINYERSGGYVCVYCRPEATHSINNNYWFIGWPDAGLLSRSYKISEFGVSNVYPEIVTSFDFKESTYLPSYKNSMPTNGYYKAAGNFSSSLNHSSILMPLICYGSREPVALNTWSAIGETKLINLGCSYYTGGAEIFINNGIDDDYHKYIVVPSRMAFTRFYGRFVIAIEIEAKEKLLHSQSQDYLIINLEDSFRNFDRIEIVYEGNNEVEWTYDDLVAVFDTDGVFNLTKDENNKCMVYGLKNEDGESREYRFTCLESCEIISITGYRE